MSAALQAPNWAATMRRLTEFIKDMAFPDPGWQVRITIGGGIMAFVGVLGCYWVFGSLAPSS